MKKVIIADVISAVHFRGIIQALRMKGSFSRNTATMYKTVYQPKDIESQVLALLQQLPELNFSVQRSVQRDVSGMYASTTQLMDADEDNILIVSVSATKAPALTTVSITSVPI